MVSYTQRNAEAKLLAAEIYTSLHERGLPVWLDVKMNQLNEEAMKEAAQNSQCIIAVVTGVEREGDPASNAYFKRDFCVNELRWAREAGVPIQPVIRREDKERVGEFLGEAPEDLQDLGGVDFLSLDRINAAMWKTCIDEVVNNVERMCTQSQPEPEPEPEPATHGTDVSPRNSADYLSRFRRSEEQGLSTGLMHDVEQSVETTDPLAEARAKHPIAQVVWVQFRIRDEDVSWTRGVVEGHDETSGSIRVLVRPMARQTILWRRGLGELRTEADHPVGQIIWVHDGKTDYPDPLAWIRGVVEGHDEASGAPLVRPVAGRPKLGDRAGTMGNHTTESVDTWSAEESQQPRTWQRAKTTSPWPSTAVGQVIWVRDWSGRWQDTMAPNQSDRSLLLYFSTSSLAVPWIRGAVEGHDEASGAPLVRPVAGRLKQGHHSSRSTKITFWSAEEGQTPRAWRHVTTTLPRFTMDNLCRCSSSWGAAADANDMSAWGRSARGLTKALLWHVLQPTLYYYVFLDAYPTLEPVQRGLGYVVAAREALYLLSVLACTWVNPAFLIIDVGATVRDTEAQADVKGGYLFLAMYVIAPEKFVAFALFGEGGLGMGGWENLALYGGALLDLCGLAALGEGLRVDNLPPALLVGYAATTLFWPATLVFLLRTVRAYRPSDSDALGPNCVRFGAGGMVCCVLMVFLVPLLVGKTGVWTLLAIACCVVALCVCARVVTIHTF